MAKSPLHKLVEVAGVHDKYCSQKLVFSKVNHSGHVAIGRLTCRKDKEHQYWWSLSPKLPTGAYFINDRVQQAEFCSGMLPVHYQRFADGAGMGQVTAKQQRKHLTEYEYKDSVEAKYSSSTEAALRQETGFHDTDESWQGINIMADACHSWRKNAKDTSVVATGESSHRVLQHVHVTKDDDHCMQHHEAVGNIPQANTCINRLCLPLFSEDQTRDYIFQRFEMAFAQSYFGMD